MAGLEFCPGHLLGRIGMLELYLENLTALHEVFYLQVKKVTEEGDEDAVTLIGLTRLARDLQKDVGQTIQELREIADDGLVQQGKARAAAKAQGKEG
jgi:hypothetical protein